MYNRYNVIVLLFVQHLGIAYITLSCYYKYIERNKQQTGSPENKKGVFKMKNYKVYVKGMYTGEIELLASEVVAVERDFEIKLVEVENK